MNERFGPARFSIDQGGYIAPAQVVSGPPAGLARQEITLYPRQGLYLSMVAQGVSLPEVREILGVSEGPIYGGIRRARERLGPDLSLRQAIIQACEQGILNTEFLVPADFNPRVFRDFTPRERQVMRQLLNIESYKKIAYNLKISWDSVKTHAHNLLNKIGATNHLQAVVYFLEASRRVRQELGLADDVDVSEQVLGPVIPDFW